RSSVSGPLSEIDFQAKLNLPRPACREHLSKLRIRAVLDQILNAVEDRIGGQQVRHGLEDVVDRGVVEHVEELRSELYPVSFRHVPILCDVQIGSDEEGEA